MRRILVVDDEPDVRQLLRFFLEREGYRVEVAEDGEAGLEAIRWFKPEVLLLNNLMPVLNGFAVLRMLEERRLLRTIRVIMATVNSDTTTFRRALCLGAVDLIAYPIDAKVLLEVVRQALDRSLSDRELVLRAKLRRVLREAKEGRYAGVLREAEQLPLEALSHEQRLELRAALLRAAQKPGSGPAAAAGERSGIDPRLSVLALAQAL